VFLRIAQGDAEKAEELSLEEESKKMVLPIKESPDQEALIKNFDEYSISEQHETGTFNVFMLNLRALLKKKFLLQVRDQRTLIIELLFPIIFIFVGLALATNKPIKEGKPRLMSPSIFPEPSHLYYNDLVPTQSM
jgi:hypothetical protein